MSPRWTWLIVLLIASSARGQDPNAEGNPGEQVMTRGPVHEAFAGPVVYDPRPGPVIAKPPPEPIQEVPPDQKPEGANIQWISGYWAWDDTRNDYLWVSGVWRNIPPGRQWVPGYWHEASGGAQWVPGAWMAEQSATQQYLASPPTSLETGPNSPPPTPESVWAPGCWVWQDARYYWRPGFWIAPQPNWVWIPAQYVWTPGGYLFTEGYWDRPIATRGQMFAPVYYAQPVYLQPNYVYQPTIGIVSSGLMVSLFVRPSCHAYYFGDYYGSNYAGVGIYPWYSYHQTRYGYDPLYSYYASSRPGWSVSIREEYVYRREHIEARPAHSYVEMNRISRTNVTVNNITVNNVRNVSFAQPINKIAANPGAGMRFQRIEAAEQRQQVRQAERLQEFRQQRARSEAVAMREHPAGGQARPRAVEMPKSPIAHASAHPAFDRAVQAKAEQRAAAPARPAHPAFDRAMEAKAEQRAAAPARPAHPAFDRAMEAKAEQRAAAPARPAHPAFDRAMEAKAAQKAAAPPQSAHPAFDRAVQAKAAQRAAAPPPPAQPGGQAMPKPAPAPRAQGPQHPTAARQESGKPVKKK
jgi:hypothetical protein